MSPRTSLPFSAIAHDWIARNKDQSAGSDSLNRNESTCETPSAPMLTP
jgi:hypothetical protein